MAINGTLGNIGVQTSTENGFVLTNASQQGIFVYDTSKDSDGGAWRYRTQNTSWYNETLNTQYRGSRREFPSLAIIVAENIDGGNVTIYDGDDPDLPMWMEFNIPSYAPGGNWSQSIVGVGYVNTHPHIPGAISMLNGQLVIGNVAASTNFQGAHIINFISDDMIMGARYGTAPNQFYHLPGKVIDRNNTTLWTHLEWYGNSAITPEIEGRMASSQVTDSAMTVLPGAEIEPKTGLPYVTIAFATVNGVTIIRDDYDYGGYGTKRFRYAVHIQSNSSAYSYSKRITFTDEGYLWWLADYDGNANPVVFRDSYAISVEDIPRLGQTNVTWDPSTNQFNGNGAHNFYSLSTGAEAGEIQIGPNSTEFTFKHLDRNAVAGNAGLAFHRPSVWNRDDRRGFAYIATASYASGWMSGNECKLAALANSATADRSIMNHDLTLVGNLTGTAVATNSDITAYSGFSTSNYLYHTNGVNYGNPGVISMMGWIKITDTSDYSYIVSLRNSTNGAIIGLAINANGTGIGGAPYMYDLANSQLNAPSDVRINDGQWHHICGTYVHQGGQGRRELYVDGKYVVGENPNTYDLSGVNFTAVGHYYTGGSLFGQYNCRGSLALVRVSNDRLNPLDIKWIYESERQLFYPNSNGTIYGSSDAVTALAYDETRKEYHVGTSQGRSVFRGITRINNTTDPVSDVISVADGMVAEQ